MEQIEVKDIQGIITRGYAHFPAADFLILSVKDKDLAKKWLKTIVPQVTPGDKNPESTALNIAFTFEGLRLLGLGKETLDSFPMEIEDGMTTRHKQHFLGDFGASDPANWAWGGKQGEPVHILLMLYAISEDALNALYDNHKALILQHGLHEIKKLDTTVLLERKEHFGFRDGIAQPTIRGLSSRKDVPENTVAAGEFILGYKNEYGQYTDSPVVDPQSDAAGALPPSKLEKGKHDLGKNGSYLVFRQLQQDVGLFWKYMDEATRTPEGKCDEQRMIALASKMVGRWPSGAPLVLSPDKDNPELSDADHFGYYDTDAAGLKCPFASHIRRSNPRDALGGTKRAVSISNKHRILRRGRPYGTPVAPSMEPEDVLKVKNITGERGLFFICFNADVGRQFEFIQNTWVNNPKFDELYDERDPITGNHCHPESAEKTGIFSIAQAHVRERHSKIPEFIITRGGAYFFMPGIKALTYLSQI